MRFISVILGASLMFFSSVIFAYEGVNVNGVNYLCENRCVVDTTTDPVTVSDCCGGIAYRQITN